MLKKFLIAVIVAVLMLSRQIAVAAADNYDWSKAPRLGNIVEFARYVENERRAGQTTFRVVLTSKSILPNVWSSMTLDKNDLVRIVPCRDFDAINAYIEDSEMRLSFGVVEYPAKTKLKRGALLPMKSRNFTISPSVSLMRQTNARQKEKRHCTFITRYVAE